jgi:hypothetical protein
MRLYYRKHNGIAPFYYEHVSQRCGETKIHTNLKIDADALNRRRRRFCVRRKIYLSDSEGSTLVSAHASTVYAV